MKMVLRTGKDVKMKRAKVRELMGFKMEELSSEVRLQLIQELIPLGLMHVREELEEEVRRLASGEV